MLSKIGGLKEMFGPKDRHPLSDTRELRKIVDELATLTPAKVVDEVNGWFDSMLGSETFSVETLYAAVGQLDDAAQGPLLKLSRDYLHAPRLSRIDERRLWGVCHAYWKLLAALYGRCLEGFLLRAKPGEAGRLPQVPVLLTRLVNALGCELKWSQFHYGPCPGELWQRLGQAMLTAEANGVATRSVQAYSPGNVSSVQNEYLRILALQAASMDCLLPLEIELAERFIAHFLPGFVFGAEVVHDNVYWVDLARPQPPLRLARMPQEMKPSLRFFKPERGHEGILALVRELEMGHDLPRDIQLGAQYQSKALLPVLRHLAAYLAPVPPQRSHVRHPVKHRMSVLSGLVNAFVVFSGEFGGRPAGLQIESWVVENVSQGGFGAVLCTIPGEWLRVGALVAMQPDGGENWLLGIVRRYQRESDSDARVGIQTVARRALSVELKARVSAGYTAASAPMPGLLFLDTPANEVSLILPPASFDLRESLEYQRDGVRYLLSPVTLVEQTPDYELARYRQRRIETE